MHICGSVVVIEDLKTKRKGRKQRFSKAGWIRINQDTVKAHGGKVVLKKS